jgi:uncharacterized protein with von Willebrand factor type A (vWA) domain
MEDFVSRTRQNSDISDEKFDAYNEYCKLIVYNRLLNDRLKELTSERDKQKQKYEILQDTFPNGKHKRFRRNAGQIKRIFKCPTCEKSYGSEASLKNHIKFKHSSYNLQSPHE